MGYAATVSDFNQALASRKVIGQALGIISERYSVDETSAFDFLARLSKTNNLKRVVAAEIVEAANKKAAGLAG
jgi:AmiR/NasT family two-component response regulator